MRRFFWFLATAILFDISGACAAPSGMLNKSVTVSMSVTIPGKGPDGSTTSNPRQITRVIYVSTQGRVFVRATRTVGRMSQEKEVAPNEKPGNLRFADDKIAGVLSFPSGAAQLTISFDGAFQTCTANVILGTDSGRPLVWKGLNGMTYTQTGRASVSSPTCSVGQGNPFN